MVHLPVPGLKRALDFMLDVSALAEPEALVRTVVEGLPRLVPSEITTLSVCDVPASTRRVVSHPGDAISVEDRACFDRLMHGHPLVRYHATHADGGSQRLSDCMPASAFQRTEIYADYYRRIGIDHVVAVPVIASPQLVMSYVLNRQGMDFSDREIALLDAMRPALANLYRFAMIARPAIDARDGAEALTPREREILEWVAAGKSDRQIAEILGTSIRTVQKHLENAYVKLGVENRTAAVMRLKAAAAVGD